MVAYENGDPANVHLLSQEICEAYWLEWLTRLQQYRIRFPEHIVNEADLEVLNEAKQQETHARNLESVAQSLGAKSLNSIGVPVANIGTTVKDEDVIEDEELSSKEPGADSLNSRLQEAWRKMWKNILQLIRSRGKAG